VHIEVFVELFEVPTFICSLVQRVEDKDLASRHTKTNERQITQNSDHELERRRRRVGREGGSSRGEEKGKIAIAHLYPATTRDGTNVLTFVLGRGFDRYKCAGLTFVPGGATTRTNVRHLYRVGRGWRRRTPVICHFYRAVPPPGTNVVICTEAKKGQR
jgi:hypothetical protein